MSLTERLIDEKIREQRDALLRAVAELREIVRDAEITAETAVLHVRAVLDDLPRYVG